VGFYSTVDAAKVDTSGLGGDYWVRNLREPVRFDDAVRLLLDAGHRVFIEVSPHPVLCVGMQETFEDVGVAAVAVPTLRRDEDGPQRIARALGQAFTAGVAVDWTAWFGRDPAPRVVDLPTYAFQHQRYWLLPKAEPVVSAADPVQEQF